MGGLKLLGTFEQKVFVIVGGSGGVGRAVAQQLLLCGAKVLLVGRNTQRLLELQQALRQFSDAIQVFVQDITDAHAAEAIVHAVYAHFGHCDGVICAAGSYTSKPLLDLTDSDWAQALAVNLTAPFAIGQAFVRRWSKIQMAGSLVYIGSVHAVVADAASVSQSASKAGLLGLTRAMAEACRASGIRVNAISPGAIAPNSSDKSSDLQHASITQKDVAQLALYLVSDAAKAVTGATIDLFGQSRPFLAPPGQDLPHVAS